VVDKIIPFLINIGEPSAARSKATLLNEIGMALIECIKLYGKKIKKMGKINRIAMCFWPVRLVPLTETRACVCSYLLNKAEKLNVGTFNVSPPPPENVIKAADARSFLDALRSYNSNYLAKVKNYKRNTVVQEALFSSKEVDYFKNFFLEMYDLNALNEQYFVLEGEPIAKSVDQIKIVQEIHDFVDLKDIKMLDAHADTISSLCDTWIQKISQEADELRASKVDTKEEEKQLTILNKELQNEKEKKIETEPNDLLKSGKYKIMDRTGELNRDLNSIHGALEKLKNAVNNKNLFLVDEAMNNLTIQYKNLGNSIDRYKTEINQLKKNIDQELYQIEKVHKQKIASLESKIAEVQKQIEEKHGQLSSQVADMEALVVLIREEKQSCLNNIETIKDMELTNVQQFLNDYTIEIKTKNIVVGIPIFVFVFVNPDTKKTVERAPIFPVMIDKNKILHNKITDSFRDKIRDLMNKFPPMVDLTENESQKANLIEMKNLDTLLEDAINDLRVKKILKQKEADKAKNIIANIIW